ncbi:hypothetical protein ACOTTU_22860 [Roseobacter sp. EG26]|uniref:hypothetical protein n=1 Tax=Roseobacter sp. EG26 TaxID=3412477 RepID=UPI003CE53DCD
MTDRALSEAAMLSSLRDIRLPADAAGGIVAELALIVGLSALAALLVAGMLRLVSLRERAPVPQTLTDRLAELRGLREGDRRVALLHLLRSHAPDRYAEVASNLYAPGNELENDALEAEVARLA